MKKTELNNLAAKKPITVKLKENEGNSSKNRNLSQDQEKTLDNIGEEILGHPSKIGEEEEIVNKVEIMDEIIRNNDKFETIKVLMEILCKELGISPESQFGVIHKALVGVTERYYKSMEDWKNLTKTELKHDIRQ